MILGMQCAQSRAHFEVLPPEEGQRQNEEQSHQFLSPLRFVLLYDLLRQPFYGLLHRVLSIVPCLPPSILPRLRVKIALLKREVRSGLVSFVRMDAVGCTSLRSGAVRPVPAFDCFFLFTQGYEAFFPRRGCRC
jgi:hypothetical protein